MFWVHQLFGVFSFRALRYDAYLTPCTELTVCGVVGLTFLFPRLVRLWWHLDLDMLKRGLILTMDVLLDCSLSRLVPNILCVSQEN